MTTAEAIAIMQKRNTPEDRFTLFYLKRKAEAEKNTQPQPVKS